MRPYLIIDVTGSLYYHQSETKLESSEDELSNSAGSVREDELEIEYGSAVSRSLSFRGPELHSKFSSNLAI